MMSISAILAFLPTFLVLPSALAMPWQPQYSTNKESDRLSTFGSILPSALSNGTATLPPPTSGLQLKALALGRGTQNYTCTPGVKTPASNGALATLFDLTPHLPPFPSAALASLPFIAPVLLNFPIPTIANSGFSTLGHHFFNAAAQPVFDLTEGGLGVTVAKKTGDILSPAGEQFLEQVLDGKPGAVDWLQLQKVDGEMQDVYRIWTAGGVPGPEGCGGGTEVEVQYAALYFFLA